MGGWIRELKILVKFALPPTSLDGVCADAVTYERTRALGVYLGHLVKQQGPERRRQG